MSMSEDDLEFHYKQTVKKRRRFQFYAGILTAAGFAIALSIVFIGGSLQNERYDIEFSVSIPVLIGSSIIIAILKPKQKKFKVEKHYLFFLRFYECFESLQNLIDSLEKSRKELYEKDGKDAKMGIEFLADYIEGWIVNDSPDALQEFLNSLSSALKKRVIPVIQKRDKDNVIRFYTLLKDLCELLYDREPTYEEWTMFNQKLNSIGTLEEEKPSKKRTMQKPLFLLKPYVGAPLIWTLFVAGLFYQKTEDFIIPLAVITGVSFAAATFLASNYVRSYVSKHQKQQLARKK